MRRLVRADQPAGQHTATWDGRDQQGRPVASGIYLYRLETPAGSEVRKLALVR
jgi:flagellar hook assembly protein FlgD